MTTDSTTQTLLSLTSVAFSRKLSLLLVFMVNTLCHPNADKDMFAGAGDPLLDHLTKMSKKVKNVVGYVS